MPLLPAKIATDTSLYLLSYDVQRRFIFLRSARRAGRAVPPTSVRRTRVSVSETARRENYHRRAYAAHRVHERV
ncbi:hypothetical protein GCM10022198_13660 [Klugiella xanthotipulae]|nr:hypothetical protein [Klugiella xanthotipulae]